MIKKLSVVVLLLSLFAGQASAQHDEQKGKVWTTSMSLIAGDAVMANHYLSDQEYSGPVFGVGANLGAFYKKSSKLSWDLDVAYFSRSYTPGMPDINIANPAKTSFYNVMHVDADYGTYYNWNPIKNLYIKAGGSFDLLFGITAGQPNHINNAIDFDFQTQFNAAAGIQYGWYFKKFGIALNADVAVPFMGMALSSGKYEASHDSFLGDQILPGSRTPLYFTSFHNLQGLNMEFGVDFLFKNITFFYSREVNNRWWNLNGIQNYRKYVLHRIGIKLDLASPSRLHSGNKYF